MTKEKKLLKNTMILSVGNVLTKLITFFLLPLYTRFLSVEEYGLVDLLNTLVSLLLPIITFQIEQGVFRKLIDLRKDTNNKQDKYVSTGFFSITKNCGLFFIVFMTISFFIHSKYKYYLAINLLAYIYASYFQQIARGYGDNKKYATSSVVSAITTIFFSIILLVGLGFGAEGMLVATISGQISCIAYLFISMKILKKLKIILVTKEIKKELFTYSIPLIPNSVSWWVFNASDRIIVNIILGLTSVGILAASHKFSGIYISMYNIFHLGWLESVSEHFNDQDFKAYFNKMFNIIVFLFISLSLTIIAIMPFTYFILIDKKFIDGYYLVPISMIGSIFNVILAMETAVYVAVKNTKAIANTAIVSAAINIIIHLCLIKFIGLYAAMISTTIAYLMLCIFRHKDINKKYIKIVFDSKKVLISFILIVIVLVFYYINIWYINIAMITIVLIYDLLINGKYVKDIYYLIKKDRSV